MPVSNGAINGQIGGLGNDEHRYVHWLCGVIYGQSSFTYIVRVALFYRALTLTTAWNCSRIVLCTPFLSSSLTVHVCPQGTGGFIGYLWPCLKDPKWAYTPPPTTTIKTIGRCD